MEALTKAWSPVARNLQRWTLGRARTSSEMDAISKDASRKFSQVFDQMRTERFLELRAQFIMPLRWILTPALLRAGWATVRMAYGPFVSSGEPLVRVGFFHTSVRVPVQFKRGKLSMTVSMTGSGQLTGLKFSPRATGGPVNVWVLPSYASTESFREETIRVGRGFYKVGGTITLPASNGQHPCVIMLAGSGPCDMDSTIGATKPFKDIAWGLASHGIAVLRFDKVTRTYGRWYANNSSITLDDEYGPQVASALSQLRRHPDIASDKIFILGHSLGAWVGPRYASDPAIAGLILMAGPARPMYRSAIDQMRYLRTLDEETNEAPGVTEEIEKLELAAKRADDLDLNTSVPAKDLPFGIGAPYWLSARNFDPLNTAAGLQKPMLVLQGGRDHQVTPDGDFPRWQKALGGNEHAQFKLYPPLNHLFIAGEGPSTPAEYDEPLHVDETVIHDIAEWILAQ